MSRTPDPIGEGIELPDFGQDPSVIGGITNNGGAIKARDSIGVFNIRSSGGISSSEHQELRQLIHFIDNGPANGFASGAYREITGDVFPTSIVWYEDSTKAQKIVEKIITYSGAFPTQIQWKMYDIDGVTLLATVTDSIVYSGPFETSRTRTIA